MEYEPLEYQRLQIRQYPARSLRETAEGKFWRRFSAPRKVTQVGVARTGAFASIHSHDAFHHNILASCCCPCYRLAFLPT
jgi:hypothetical protein